MRKGACLSMVKEIAVYGSYEARVHIKQRYWIKRIDGIRQRYWEKTARTKAVDKSGRFEFSGSGEELYEAVVLAHRYVPDGFVSVSAREFIENPEEYGSEGDWIEKDVES